jgi:NTP pyrophosphatase (non-canonical NTP hydrolase)
MSWLGTAVIRRRAYVLAAGLQAPAVSQGDAHMGFDEYQEGARRTALYADRDRVIYPALGLASEAGEVAGKIKKVLRDLDGDFASAPLDAIKDELGDVLWYVAALAGDLGLSLDDIATINLAKLGTRMERGTIGGAGDQR